MVFLFNKHVQTALNVIKTSAVCLLFLLKLSMLWFYFKSTYDTLSKQRLTKFHKYNISKDVMCTLVGNQFNYGSL